MPIQILGINAAGLESGNPSITAGRALPWLQDTPEANVWAAWQVTFRDVVILDTENRPVAAYNLTVHDLADPASYAELKQLLTDAAGE